jgi:hypothetical protein
MNRAYDGALTCIHKVKDGHDNYFFANSTDSSVDATVVLRGAKRLSKWDPHTGQPEPVEISPASTDDSGVTTVRPSLEAVKSVFFISE